jgi:hypothetical protein
MTEKEQRAVMALAVGELLAALPPATPPGRNVLRRAFGYQRSIGPAAFTPQMRAQDAARASADDSLDALRRAAQLALGALGRELSGDGTPAVAEDRRAPAWLDAAYRGA